MSSSNNSTYYLVTNSNNEIIGLFSDIDSIKNKLLYIGGIRCVKGFKDIKCINDMFMNDTNLYYKICELKVNSLYKDNEYYVKISNGDLVYLSTHDMDYKDTIGECIDFYISN